MESFVIAALLQKKGIPVLRYQEPSASCDGEIDLTPAIHIQVPLGAPENGLAVIVQTSAGQFEFGRVCRNFDELLAETRRTLPTAIA